MTMNRFKLLGLALGLALVALSLVPLPAHAVLRSRQLRRPVDLLFKRHLHHGGRPIRKRLRRLHSLGETDYVLHRGHLAELLANRSGRSPPGEGRPAAVSSESQAAVETAPSRPGGRRVPAAAGRQPGVTPLIHEAPGQPQKSRFGSWNTAPSSRRRAVRA
jgi:hypothetical protein